MAAGLHYDDEHRCRGCWVLQESELHNDFEEITAHEDPAGRYMTITGFTGDTERYSLDDPIARAFLESRGLDWR
ncbi:hypothetical protein [Microbacterium album]|uniref:Uncharacterized protein n=1 Tax=Microbacterium album TaxID=2053191 RepID=A0A917ICG9_9MICO|nr:hypothetical protein [Microbacterium album]GGH38702.1 hypothetical protein GCM10010921_09460 [Microbacterium album]